MRCPSLLLLLTIFAPSTAADTENVETVLEQSRERINNKLFLYQTPTNSWEPSSVYQFDGFIAGLRVMYTDGVADKHFYMGDSSSRGALYGLVNIAAFLAQSMKETIKYDACDENSWDLVNGRYPLSNACGQLRQSYQDYHCKPEEAHMECKVDKNMEITAVTNAKWYGAPGPLKCGPKSTYQHTGYWDYNYECNKPWASPPEFCNAYEGQKAGGENNAAPYPNRNGRDDVEGCCYWGRGVIQTTGICNFGKLNYYLGKRAADEGRPSRYPTIDFCADPEAICSSQEFQELKWIAGFFYWVESVQTYDEGGWNYLAKLHDFVDGGMTDYSFIDAVSGIVNRGCHNPPCGTGPLDGGAERKANFKKVLEEFGLDGTVPPPLVAHTSRYNAPTSTVSPPPNPSPQQPSPTAPITLPTQAGSETAPVVPKMSTGCPPVWEADDVHVGNDQVTYQGIIYKAKWWTQGEQPDTTELWGVWEKIGPCQGETGGTQQAGSQTGGTQQAGSQTGCPPVWEAGDVYVGNDQVTYQGMIYKAKWWTRGGVEPGTTGQGGVWEKIGPCQRRHVRRAQVQETPQAISSSTYYSTDEVTSRCGKNRKDANCGKECSQNEDCAGGLKCWDSIGCDNGQRQGLRG